MDDGTTEPARVRQRQQPPRMREERRTVLHPFASWEWGPLVEVAPEFGLELKKAPGAPDDAELPVFYGFKFLDPDGEGHIVIFTEEAKRELVAKMTGGVVLPGT